MRSPVEPSLYGNHKRFDRFCTALLALLDRMRTRGRTFRAYRAFRAKPSRSERRRQDCSDSAFVAGTVRAHLAHVASQRPAAPGMDLTHGVRDRTAHHRVRSPEGTRRCGLVRRRERFAQRPDRHSRLWRGRSHRLSGRHKPSLQRMGVETQHVVNVGGFTEGQRRFLDFHRNAVLLREVR